MNVNITQENVHLLIPSKIALMTDMLAEELNIDIIDAIKRIYASRLYRELEIESTKLWHLGPVALFQTMQGE